jgi:hypothetical protein
MGVADAAGIAGVAPRTTAGGGAGVTVAGSALPGVRGIGLDDRSLLVCPAGRVCSAGRAARTDGEGELETHVNTVALAPTTRVARPKASGRPLRPLAIRAFIVSP